MKLCKHVFISMLFMYKYISLTEKYFARSQIYHLVRWWFQRKIPILFFTFHIVPSHLLGTPCFTEGSILPSLFPERESLLHDIDMFWVCKGMEAILVKKMFNYLYVVVSHWQALFYLFSNDICCGCSLLKIMSFP